MTTILLAVGSSWLRRACESMMQNLGYTALPIDRPLAPLSVSKLVGWDAALLDATPLGEGALHAFALLASQPLIGLGLSAPGLAKSVPLPLREPDLAAALDSVLFAESPSDTALRLDPSRSFALAGSAQVHLTHTEFRLLQLLYDARPADVPLSDVLIAVWGSTEGEATSELVRSHLRNLRRKLEQLDLTDVIRSRRGLGYSLHL